uniref:Uncharacterized protein n=1 Tax=Anguilla anguilla TaxID=7936 RepID=A0A0E9RGL4_ANGAN
MHCNEFIAIWSILRLGYLSGQL